MKTITIAGGFLMAAGLTSGALLTGNQAAAQTASDVVCTGCVQATDIASNAVIGAKIADGVITADKLHGTAKPAGADFTAPVDRVLSGANTVVTTLVMNLPAAGVVIVNSGGHALFNDNPSGFLCAITKGTSTAGEPIVVGENHNVIGARRMPVATTRGFAEPGAGIQRYKFVCSGHGSTTLLSVLLTGIYVPRRY